MAVDFQGRWRASVVGRNAGFSQRVLVTGAASGNGAYDGVVGNSFEFTGGQVDLQWNDEAGSGWQPSAIITSIGMSSPLVVSRFLSADDNYPDRRDGDYDDLSAAPAAGRCSPSDLRPLQRTGRGWSRITQEGRQQPANDHQHQRPRRRPGRRSGRGHARGRRRRAHSSRHAPGAATPSLPHERSPRLDHLGAATLRSGTTAALPIKGACGVAPRSAPPTLDREPPRPRSLRVAGQVRAPARHINRRPAMSTNHADVRPNAVNAALTRNRRNRPRVEKDDYGAFARRIVAAHGRRIVAGDVECLRELVALAEEVDRATDVAVAGLRRVGYSCAEIARRLGITRQAAQQRWGSNAA
jgi:hypothetical protein